MATGENLRFGGEVMKNVAGYDVSRLMTGSMGTLAVLLDVSMKVLPRPQVETTVEFEHTPAEAVTRFNEWAGQPIPLSARLPPGWSLTSASLRQCFRGGDRHCTTGWNRDPRRRNVLARSSRTPACVLRGGPTTLAHLPARHRPTAGPSPARWPWTGAERCAGFEATPMRTQ